MEPNQEIQNELREISPLLADMVRVNPFILPERYFLSLPAIILERIQNEAILQYAKGNVYNTPEGYFDSLPGQILSKIQQADTVNEVSAELAELAPLLNTISKKQVYSVPQGYFENTDLAAAAKQTKEPAKVFSIRSARRWMQYAAAAVVTGVLITGAFMFTDNSNNYLEYEKYSRVDIPTELDKVTEDELEKYLNNPEHFAIAPAVTISSEEDALDVKSSVQLLSDDELTQYLKENAESASEKNNE